MKNNLKSSLAWAFTGLVLLGWASASQAQTQGVGGGAGGAGGGAGGAGGGAGGASGGSAFQGGQALQGGLGALGQQGGAGQSGSFTQQLNPGSSSSYGTTSFLGPYYANPLSIGIPSSLGNSGGSGAMGSSKPTFGQALFNTSSSGGGQFGSTSAGSNFGSRQSNSFGASGSSSGGTRSGTTGQSRNSTTRQGGGALGGGGGNRGIGGGNAGGQGAFGGGIGGGGINGGGIGGSQLNGSGYQAVQFQTTIGYPVPTAAPARMRADLQEVIARTTSLPSRAGIQTLAQGDAVVLRGTVGSEQERRLAEAIVRLTPGVFDLHNELEVRETAPAPKPSP